MDSQTIIITGSSGFLGSAICVDLNRDHHIIGMDRRPPAPALIRRAPTATWHHIDIADTETVSGFFRDVAARYPRIDYVIHMAAFYHFGRYWLPEYERTNVLGLRNILDGALHVGARRFVFAGSIASLPPPAPDCVLTEQTIACAYSAYTRSKTIGEKMLAQYSRLMPTVALRIGGVFSDWCELPPLYSLMKLWGQPGLLGKMIPGRGNSGFPYIHRRDLVASVRKIIEADERLARFEIFFASPSGYTSHQALFPVIRRACGKDASLTPIYIAPKLAKFVLYLKNRFKVLMGRKRYERRWMIDYVDTPLVVDTAYTQRMLRWSPRPELNILNCLPGMMRRFQANRRAWERRNVRRNEGRYEYEEDRER